MQLSPNIFKGKKKKKEHVKKVFLESRCRQTVNILSSPDACWLREDLCLPVVPLTSLSDSLADSWGAAVTLRLLSFFHMPHHLAQSAPHPSLVSERSQKAAPWERFPPEPQGLPGASERWALLLQVGGNRLAEMGSSAQHNAWGFGRQRHPVVSWKPSWLKEGRKITPPHPSF